MQLPIYQETAGDFALPIMTRSAPRGGHERGGPPSANQERGAGIEPGSYNANARTLRVILSAGASVKRFGMIEEINLDPAAVNLSRVAKGQVKFLDSHNSGSLGAILGTVTAARFEGGALVGEIALADNAAARGVEPSIADGTIKGISIGYRVDQWTLVATGEVETWRADKWELLEVSAVSVPADAGAMIRSASEEHGELENDPRPSPISAKRAIALINSSADIGFRDLAEQLVNAGLSEDAVRRRVMDAVVEKSRADMIGKIPPAIYENYGAHMHNAQTLDNPAFLRNTLENALYARMTGKPPEGSAREFIDVPLSAYEDILAGQRGGSWLSRAARWGGPVRGLHATSDFQNLLMTSGNRVLQEQYQNAQSPLMMLGRERQASDFRTVSVLRLSKAPSLDEVGESGEITYGTRAEEKEAFSLKTFARIFGMTRQAYINDDLNAFGDFLNAYARAAAESAAGQLVALLTANSGNGVNMGDGNPLFTTARANKAASGTAIDIANLGLARKALRETKDIDGKTPINLVPRYLVVTPAKETEAEQAISQILANQISNANPFSGKLEVLVEPRLSGNAWRVFADPAQQSVISFAYLNGQRGPTLETREGWNTLGVEFRAVLYFGCGATDWRGAYLNPGN
jgi:HK97 family phage prohead protease